MVRVAVAGATLACRAHGPAGQRKCPAHFPCLPAPPRAVRAPVRRRIDKKRLMLTSSMMHAKHTDRKVTLCDCLHVQLKTNWFPGMTGATAKAKYDEAHCMGYC